MIAMHTLTRRAPLAALTAMALTGGVVAPVAGASADHHKSSHKHKTVVKKVKVADNYFSPTKMTIRVGDKVNFVWAPFNVNTHNVTLVKGPKGVKKSKFTSLDASTHFHFERTFTVPGKYHFRCTMHPTVINLYLTVKR
jgi:plastocyanin